MPRVAAVLFDFGNVVGFFDHRRAAAQLAALGTASADDVFEQVFKSGLEPGFDCGLISPADFIARLRKRFELSATDAAIDDAWSDIFRPNEEVSRLLPRLKRAGLRLVLASNTNELHVQRLEREFSRELSAFDTLVLSCRVGSRKPDPQFFDVCLTAAAVPASQCIFVDDRHEFVDAAIQAGMRGIVYPPPGGLEAALAREGVRLES